MDLKSFINKNEGGEFIKETIVEQPATVELKENVSEEIVEIKFEELENEVLDVKIEVPTERIVTEKSELNFVGSFNYVPDPIEYNEGSIYKNINEGVAYIRKGLLWEELVRDGKPGRDAARVGGSGVGVAEVKSITGMLGIFDSKAELDKVPTTNLKIGTIATLPSGPVTWRGASAGWVAEASETPAKYLAGFSPFDQIVGNKLAMWGSSTIAYCTASGLTNTIYFDGPLYHAIGQSGAICELVYNGGQGGTLASTISAKYIAEVGTTTHDVSWLQFGANDLADGTDPDAFFPHVLAAVLAGVAAKKKIILHTPHTRYPITQGSPLATHANYARFSAMCADLCTRFPGQVYLADVYTVLCNGRDTPQEYLVDSAHLNALGAYKAGQAFIDVFREIFGFYDEIEALSFSRTLSNKNHTPPTGLTATFATASAGPVYRGGKTSVRTIASSAGGTYYSSTGTFVQGNIYKMFADFFHLNGPCPELYIRSSNGTISKGSGSYRSAYVPTPSQRYRVYVPQLTANADIVSGPRFGMRTYGADTSLDIISMAPILVG